MFRGDKTKNKNYEQTLTLKFFRKIYLKRYFKILVTADNEFFY